MSNSAMKHLGHELALLLTAALPLMEAEARRERAREQFKPIRKITAQRRAERARALVAEAREIFGYEV
jgi:hypothetical protein